MPPDQVYLENILTAGKLIAAYLEGFSFNQFLGDIKTQDSVIRRFEIIREAAKRISLTTKKQHPEIPWGNMVGMRNWLIHEYDNISLTLVWQTVLKELPNLMAQAESILTTSPYNFEKPLNP